MKLNIETVAYPFFWKCKAPKAGFENKFESYLKSMKTMLSFTCDHCTQLFHRELRQCHKSRKRKFCSQKCAAGGATKSAPEPCAQCGTSVVRIPSQRGKNVFCNTSCAATYNNKHKAYGLRRSKLENWLEECIRVNFPEIELLCNSKSAIGSELDFYFPVLRLGIEINGIFHYEPIYGLDKLALIQANDKQKLIGCAKMGIELIVVPAITRSKKDQEELWNGISAILKSRI